MLVAEVATGNKQVVTDASVGAFSPLGQCYLVNDGGLFHLLKSASASLREIFPADLAD